MQRSVRSGILLALSVLSLPAELVLLYLSGYFRDEIYLAAAWQDPFQMFHWLRLGCTLLLAVGALLLLVGVGRRGGLWLCTVLSLGCGVMGLCRAALSALNYTSLSGGYGWFAVSTVAGECVLLAFSLVGLGLCVTALRAEKRF